MWAIYAHTAAPGSVLLGYNTALHFFKKNPPAEMSGYGPDSYNVVTSLSKTLDT